MTTAIACTALLGLLVFGVLGTMWFATANRYSLALGLILSPTLEKPHPLRFVGALGTYLSGTALCVAALLAI